MRRPLSRGGEACSSHMAPTMSPHQEHPAANILQPAHRSLGQGEHWLLCLKLCPGSSLKIVVVTCSAKRMAWWGVVSAAPQCLPAATLLHFNGDGLNSGTGSLNKPFILYAQQRKLTQGEQTKRSLAERIAPGIPPREPFLSVLFYFSIINLYSLCSKQTSCKRDRETIPREEPKPLRGVEGKLFGLIVWAISGEADE